jgi:hypothetical protein
LRFYPQNVDRLHQHGKGEHKMRENQLLKGTIIRTIFVFVELVALGVISVITFSNDGTSAWG